MSSAAPEIAGPACTRPPLHRARGVRSAALPHAATPLVVRQATPREREGGTQAARATLPSPGRTVGAHGVSNQRASTARQARRARSDGRTDRRTTLLHSGLEGGAGCPIGRVNKTTGRRRGDQRRVRCPARWGGLGRAAARYGAACAVHSGANGWRHLNHITSFEYFGVRNAIASARFFDSTVGIRHFQESNNRFRVCRGRPAERLRKADRLLCQGQGHWQCHRLGKVHDEFS